MARKHRELTDSEIVVWYERQREIRRKRHGAARPRQRPLPSLEAMRAVWQKACQKNRADAARRQAKRPPPTEDESPLRGLDVKGDSVIRVKLTPAMKEALLAWGPEERRRFQEWRHHAGITCRPLANDVLEFGSLDDAEQVYGWLNRPEYKEEE